MHQASKSCSIFNDHREWFARRLCYYQLFSGTLSASRWGSWIKCRNFTVLNFPKMADFWKVLFRSSSLLNKFLLEKPSDAWTTNYVTFMEHSSKLINSMYWWSNDQKFKSVFGHVENQGIGKSKKTKKTQKRKVSIKVPRSKSQNSKSHTP